MYTQLHVSFIAPDIFIFLGNSQDKKKKSGKAYPETSWSTGAQFISSHNEL